MPVVPFDQLPGDSRLWVFAAERPLSSAEAESLLAVVDQFLAHWKAHGAPLTAARDWRYDRFLLVGVDEASAGASGCSIDAMVRQLQQLETALGVSTPRSCAGTVPARQRDRAPAASRVRRARAPRRRLAGHRRLQQLADARR